MCKQEVFGFQDHNGRKVTSDFSGGHLSSDAGGVVLLRELERKSGIIDRLQGCFSDERDMRYVEHSLGELLRQRLGSLALGYEDLNDADSLRHDPALALLSGKNDIEGLDRMRESDKGKALAAHSTLNRLELGAVGGDGRYIKILANSQKLADLLIEEGVRAIPRKSRQIVLDFDATDDPLHGSQQGAYFHGYYGHYCYLPLYCFCGNIPLLALLRDCKGDASEGTAEALEKIVAAMRRRFGRKIKIIVRADSGFAREQIMLWCEQNNVFYCLGLARNQRLAPHLQASFAQLHTCIEEGLESMPARRFVDFEYRTIKSWSRSRRVVGKAEVLEKGDNPRFIVTNLDIEEFPAQRLYEKFYCARGDMENRIKEQQQDLFADRTSTMAMASNQLRLWFSAFTHLILSRMQAEVLARTPLAKATIGTIRLRLFKIAGRLTVSCRRIHFQLSGACPDKQTFAMAWRNLQAWPS